MGLADAISTYIAHHGAAAAAAATGPHRAGHNTGIWRHVCTGHGEGCWYVDMWSDELNVQLVRRASRRSDQK